MMRTESRRRATIQATDLHKKPGEVMKRVVVDNEELIVERAGYPAMVLMPYRTYERLELERRQAMMEELESQGITEENFMDDPDWQRIKQEESQKLYDTIHSKKKVRKPRTKKA